MNKKTETGQKMKIIARIKTDFPTKFGIPRQSGLVPELTGKIVFEPEYRNEDALKGLEGYSHIWLIWEFSEAVRDTWSPTVRPPRLGGNVRMGVFATRSPFRPNALGLSSVRLLEIRKEPGEGTVLLVSGADLMDGTPVYDIKPYLPMTDAHPDALAGFAGDVAARHLDVEFPDELLEEFSPEEKRALIGVLSQDPRPAYQRDPERIYGMPFAGRDIRFKIKEDRVYVVEVRPCFLV